MLPDLWLSRPQGRKHRRHTSQKVQKPLEAAEPCLPSERLAWDPAAWQLPHRTEPAPGPLISPCSRRPSCRACPGGGGLFRGWAPGLGLLHMVGPAEIHGPEEALLL